MELSGCLGKNFMVVLVLLLGEEDEGGLVLYKDGINVVVVKVDKLRN